MKKNVLFFSLIVVLLSISFVTAHHNRTKPVQWFSDGSMVKGGWSTLRTEDDGASFNLHTTHLTPGDAVTIWWVIFNHPEECDHGVMGFRCGEGDLEEEGVDASVLYADGHVIKWNGVGNFDGNLEMGDTTGALFGPGLTNPQGADIHFVVHSHGPAIRGLTREMTHTFGGGCNNVPEGTGTPGPNTCVDLQFSVHEQ